MASFDEYALVKPHVEKIARELMDNCDLADVPFGWNRGKRQMGVCYFSRETKKATKIELSQYILDLPFEDIRNTILHEIAHAIAGHEAGHNWYWKQIARALGCTGDRCITIKPENHQPFNYTISCDTCGWENGAYRVSAKKRRHICKTCRGPITIRDIRGTE